MPHQPGQDMAISRGPDTFIDNKQAARGGSEQAVPLYRCAVQPIEGERPDFCESGQFLKVNHDRVHGGLRPSAETAPMEIGQSCPLGGFTWKRWCFFLPGKHGTPSTIRIHQGGCRIDDEVNRTLKVVQDVGQNVLRIIETFNTSGVRGGVGGTHNAARRCVG